MNNAPITRRRISRVLDAFIIGILTTTVLFACACLAGVADLKIMLQVFIWQNTILQSIICSHFVLTLMHSKCKCSHFNFGVFIFSLPLGVVIYGGLAYALLYFIELRQMHLPSRLVSLINSIERIKIWNKLLLILAILFIILIPFALPGLLSREVYKRETAARFDIYALEKVLETYRKEQGRYPTNEEGLCQLNKTSAVTGKPYVHVLIKDPWGHDFHYCNPGLHNITKYDLWSYGADNLPRGEGKNKDVTNWDEHYLKLKCEME